MVTETKEPWEMTRDDFTTHPTKKATVAGITFTYEENNGKYIFHSGKTFGWETPSNVHRMETVAALREGKPVPAGVLRDYPDLKRQAEVEAITPEVTPEYKEVQEAWHKIPPEKQESIIEGIVLFWWNKLSPCVILYKKVGRKLCLVLTKCWQIGLKGLCKSNPANLFYFGTLGGVKW